MGKLILGLISLPIVGGIFSFILNIFLVGALALTYTSLSQEKLIATITFDKENKSQLYKAHIYDADGSKINDYIIYGDQWRLDAGFIKMEYWANIFSIDSKYTLNRFEGRYKNIDDQNNKPHKSYQLEEHSLIDNFGWFFDTAYGSSVYKDIKLETKYKILKTQTGLMVREEPIVIKEEKSMLEKMKGFFG